jgi:hypothetical protein
MRFEKMRKVAILLLVSSFLLGSSLFAQDTLWTRTYGGDDGDQAYSVCQTGDGGFAIGGSTWSFGLGQSDYYLVRTDSDGDTLWTKTYGLSFHQDEFREMKPTADGGFVLVGYAYSETYEDWVVYVVRTDANGDTLWTRDFGKGQGDAVDETGDGGFIIVGSIFTDHTAMLLIRTDANGDTLWTRIFDHQHGDFRFNAADAVEETSDGGLIIGGSTQCEPWILHAYLIKTDANGDTLWTRTYATGGYNAFHSVQETSDGGFIVASSMYSEVTWSDDALLVKYDADGNVEWDQTYGTSDIAEWANSARETLDGGFILAGGDSDFMTMDARMYVVKTDSEGNLQWSGNYFRTTPDGMKVGNALSVVETEGGGFAVAGQSVPEGSWSSDMYLVRIRVPQVSIAMIPDDPVIVIPAGESFTYEGRLTNNTLETQTVDVWFKVKKPYSNHWLYPHRHYTGLTVEPFQTNSYYPVTQGTPPGVYPGVYTYIGYCGTYGDEIVDSTYLYVTIYEFKGSGQQAHSDWSLYGWGDEEVPEAGRPTTFALRGNYPNPFNARTVISYELPTDAHVKLEIYNLFGQKVATLVDGQQEAGYRSVTWDASEVPSGVYFYKLSGGDFTETRRMMLVK